MQNNNPKCFNRIPVMDTMARQDWKPLPPAPNLIITPLCLSQPQRLPGIETPPSDPALNISHSALGPTCQKCFIKHADNGTMQPITAALCLKLPEYLHLHIYIYYLNFETLNQYTKYIRTSLIGADT